MSQERYFFNSTKKEYKAPAMKAQPINEAQGEERVDFSTPQKGIGSNMVAQAVGPENNHQVENMSPNTINVISRLNPMPT